jgi:magnesium-transporting ATPase (P-type)
VLEHLESGPVGLSEAEAAARHDRNGPNRIARREGPRRLTIWLAQVRSPLIYTLLASAALALALGEQISADMRLLGASSLPVDESTLTGESVPVARARRPSR